MKKFTFNTIQRSLLNSLTKQTEKNRVNYLTKQLPWVMQGSRTLDPTLNNYFSLHVFRQHTKMVDYYEPMTVIHMTDDLQLVTKTKNKKFTFSPDADKHIVLIQGSESVPTNLISESETRLVTADTDNVMYLGMLDPVVPLPEIGKEVDLETRKVVASKKRKIFPDIDWDKSPSLLFSDDSVLFDTESVTPTGAKRPDTGDGGVQTKKCKLFHLSDTDDDTHGPQSADNVFLDDDEDEYFVKESPNVTGAGIDFGSTMVVPESPIFLTESELSTLCVKIKEYKYNQINMKIEERVRSAIYNVQHKKFMGR